MQFGDTLMNEPIVPAIGPEDLYTGTNNGTWLCMAKYPLIEAHIITGDLTGGAAAVTLEQATALAGTGGKALGFTRYYQTGQRIYFNNRSATNFVVGDTITGAVSNNTALVIEVSKEFLLVAFLTGSTTWTAAEGLTTDVSGATANVVGTGTDEDTMVPRTAAGNTFSTIATATFKHWCIPIQADMLDVANDFDCVRIVIAKAAGSETQGCAFYVLKLARWKKLPMPTAIDAVKIV